MTIGHRFVGLTLAVAGFLAGSVALAAGFEKNIMWSGRHGGVGGTAVSFVEGSEALYFNPAGLVTSAGGQDISGNLSLIQSKFEGPGPVDARIESKDKTSTPFSLLYGKTLNEKLGFGVGAYVSGGSTAQFENVNINALFPNRAELKTDILIYEIAAGVGYQVVPGLKLGAAYRVGFAEADFYTVGRLTAGNPLTTANIKLKDLKADNFAGFKVGAQYSPDKTWGLGLTVRTEYKFDLEGDRTNTPLATGVESASESVNATAYFPTQIALGGHWQAVPEVWHFAAEYNWTDYSKNDTLNAVSPTSGTLPIVLKWKDQSAVRLGAEFLRTKLPIRFGYVWTSQVTPNENAIQTLTAPGDASTVTLGTGYAFMEKRLNLNAAIDYTWVSGDGTAPATVGEYETTALALHTGLTYSF